MVIQGQTRKFTVLSRLFCPPPPQGYIIPELLQSSAFLAPLYFGRYSNTSNVFFQVCLLRNKLCFHTIPIEEAAIRI